MAKNQDIRSLLVNLLQAVDENGGYLPPNIPQVQKAPAAGQQNKKQQARRMIEVFWRNKYPGF